MPSLHSGSSGLRPAEARSSQLSGRASFGKRDRERAKREKAAAKREQRQARSAPGEENGDEPAVPVAVDPNSTAELLEMIETLHQRFDAGAMDYEEFEKQKSDLLGRLTVE